MTAITTKRLTQLSASLLTASALLLPGLALANEPTGAHAPSAIAMNVETKPTTEFGKLRKMLQPLNLSAEQQEAVKGAIDGLKVDAQAIHDEMRANKEKLKAQQFADQYNVKETEALADAQGNLVERMIVLRSKLDREVYAILTPEQREQLRAQIAEKEQRKANRRGAKAEKQPKPE